MPHASKTEEQLQAEERLTRIDELRRELAKLNAEADDASTPGWYPPAAPTDEDMYHRQFPRGTHVTEVLEYERQEAERRLLESGRDRRQGPLPKGTVTATKEEFLAD